MDQSNQYITCPYQYYDDTQIQIKVSSRVVKIFNIFEDWRVLFHGTRPGVLASILSEGRLMKAGDTLITGEKLKSVNSNGRQKDGVGVEYSHVVYHYLPITQPLYDILLEP